MKGKVTLTFFTVTFFVFLYQLQTGVLVGVTPSDLHLVDFALYAFFHSSSTHLAFNLAALLFFGYMLEEKVGSEKLLVLFVTTMIFAGIVYTVIYPFSARACVGLSGVVFGVIGGNLVLYKGKYKNYFLLSTLSYMGVTVFLIYIDLVGTIAHAAHLGGFLMGALLILCYEKRSEGYLLMGLTIGSTAYLVGS